MPFHSIITANYNYRPFLQRMAESVFAQLDQDFEWIIVDDGSIDGSQERLKSIQAQDPTRVKLILQENQGQAAAFNVAFEEATGAIISFLDSDDWWSEDKLSWVREESKVSENCLFQHNLEFHDGNQSLGRSVRENLECGDLFQTTRKRNRRGFYLPLFTPTTGLSFRRESLLRVFPIPVLFRTCADGFITRSAFCYGSVASTNRNLGFYRAHGGNAVLGNNDHKIAHYIRNELVPELNAYYRRKGISLRYRLRYSDGTSRGLIGWLQRKLTERIVKSVGCELRRVFPLEEIVNQISPKRILVVRSDRNLAALAELRSLMPNSRIDWLVSANAPEEYRDSLYVDEIIEYPGEGNIDLDSIPDLFLEDLRGRGYDLILYTCVDYGHRVNVRTLCKSLNVEWFGYQGAGYLYLEGWDSLRLRKFV